jgi:excisionase family DNA binding protein
VNSEQAILKSTTNSYLFTLDQVAERLQVSTKTVRRWISAGDLITHRFGRQLRVSSRDLETFIRRHRKCKNEHNFLDPTTSTKQ